MVANTYFRIVKRTLTMSKTSLAAGAAFLFAILCMGCGIDRQTKELRALEKCEYELVSADSVLLAGTDVGQLIKSGRVDLARLPGVAMGFLSGNVPLSAVLNVRVTNPTNTLAGIRQFAYIIEVEGQELIDGTSDLPVRVPAGETVTVPVRLQGNMYQMLSNQSILQRVMAYVQATQAGTTNEPVNMTIKIKPTVALGNSEINYPGYISIHREFDPSTLIR